MILRLKNLLKIKNWSLFTKVLLGVYFCTSNLNAQINLVPNSSFETFTSCPSFPGQVEFAFPWYNPTNSSPDYFNACNTFSVGIPQNFMGFQYPRTGNANMGLYVVDANDKYIKNQFALSFLRGNNFVTLGAPNDLDYQNFHSSMLVSNIGKSQKCKEKIHDKNLIGADSVLTGFIDTNLIEYNFKKTALLFTGPFQTKSLLLSDSLFLDSLAKKIPKQYGDAVIVAQEMMRLDIPYFGLVERAFQQTNQNGNIIDSNIKIYPNPAHNKLVVQSVKESNLQIKVVNLVGEEIESKICTGNACEIFTNSYLNGIYIILVYKEGLLIKHEKIIIEH